MTTSIRTTSEYLLVAIDVAKRVHEVLIHWPSGESRAFKVPNQCRPSAKMGLR